MDYESGMPIGALTCAPLKGERCDLGDHCGRAYHDKAGYVPVDPRPRRYAGHYVVRLRGEGGTMIIVEHTEDRCSMNEHPEDGCSMDEHPEDRYSMNMADITAEPAAPAPSPAERNGPVRVSA